MKTFFQIALIATALLLAFGYLYYLLPVDLSCTYFANLPPALTGFFFFVLKNPFTFGWMFIIAMSGLGISFLVLEKGLKLRLPAGFMLGVGLGLLGLLIFFLGTLHLLLVNLIRGLVLATALPGLYLLFSRLRPLKITRTSIIEASVIFLFSIPLLMTLVHPTYFYDALYYHLALPRQYLLRNSIAPIPSISYSHFPEIAEMIYLAGLAVSGQVAAQLVNFLFWLAIILLGRELFQALFGPDKKIFAVIALLALPIFSLLGGLISNDLVLGFFILTGSCVLVMKNISSGKRAFVFGLVAGLACSVKLNAYLYMLIPQSLWLAYLILNRDKNAFVKSALIALAAFVFVCAPFLIRNFATVGNPFFPALTSVLGGPLSPEQSLAIWRDAQGATWSPKLWENFFTIPHEFVYHPVGIKFINPDRLLPFPLIGLSLPAGLLLLLLKKPEKKLVPLCIYCAVFYLLWAFSFRLSRFAIGLWIILAVLSASGFAMLHEKRKPFATLTTGALGIALLVGLILAFLSGARMNGWNMLIGRMSQEEYLKKISSVHPVEMGAYPVYEWLNQNAGADEQVALLGPTSSFYLQRKTLANSYIDWNPLLLMFNRGKSAEDVCGFLDKEKIRWLVYQPGEIDRLGSQYPANRLSETGSAGLTNFLKSPCLEQVMSSKSRRIYLFKIRPAVF
jgi:hypothetical protein